MRKWVLLIAICLPGLSLAQPPAPVTARAELAAAIDHLKAQHMNAAKLDWPAAESKAYAMIAEDAPAEAAYPAIRFLIGQLGEKHTFLFTAEAQKQMRDLPASTDPGSLMVLPKVEEIGKDIGRLQVYGVMGDKFSDAYERAVRDGLAGLRARGVCRFIVDLRENEGGNMWPMLNALLPLLGQPPYGFFHLTGSQRHEWGLVRGRVEMEKSEDGANNEVAIKDAKVAVLLGARTTSSGEQTAIALKGAPGTRFFGQPSYGYVSNNQGFGLPDTSVIVISNGYSRDRNGVEYRERITPDVVTPEGQATLDAAADWLRAQSCSVN